MNAFEVLGKWAKIEAGEDEDNRLEKQLKHLSEAWQHLAKEDEAGLLRSIGIRGMDSRVTAWGASELALRENDYEKAMEILEGLEESTLADERVKRLLNRKLTDQWDRAHYMMDEKRTGRKPTPLSRFRTRKRNPAPAAICPDGRHLSTALPKRATDSLKSWLATDGNTPYPKQSQRRQLSEATGLSEDQVKTWFANARRRSSSKSKSKPPVLDRQHTDTATRPMPVDFATALQDASCDVAPPFHFQPRLLSGPRQVGHSHQQQQQQQPMAGMQAPVRSQISNAGFCWPPPVRPSVAPPTDRFLLMPPPATYFLPMGQGLQPATASPVQQALLLASPFTGEMQQPGAYNLVHLASGSPHGWPLETTATAAHMSVQSADMAMPMPLYGTTPPSFPIASGSILSPSSAVTSHAELRWSCTRSPIMFASVRTTAVLQDDVGSWSDSSPMGVCSPATPAPHSVWSWPSAETAAGPPLCMLQEPPHPSDMTWTSQSVECPCAETGESRGQI